MRVIRSIAAVLIGSAISAASAQQPPGAQPSPSAVITNSTAGAVPQWLPGAPGTSTLVSGGSDNCATATPIAGQGTYVGDSIGATTDGPSAPCVSLGQDVWYNWTATDSETKVISFCPPDGGSASFDTALVVYNGSSCVGSMIACNDDFCGLQSQVTFTPVAGNVYKIRIGGVSAATGSYAMAITKLQGCIDRPTGMVAWYTGDDSTPSDLLGQHDGAFVGSPASSPNWKVGGGALLVYAPSTYVIVPDSPGILSFGNPTDNFSIDAWVNVAPGNSSGVRPIVDKRVEIQNSVWGYAFYLYNGFLGFQLADGPYTNYVSNAYVADGLWHLVAVTVERTAIPPQVVLYVDGQIVFSGAARTGNANNNADLWIGSGHPIVIPQPYLTGLIDELELFNRALTPTDILAIFQADYAGKCKCTDPPLDMVAWWPLDETGPPTAADIAGTSDGTQECVVTFGPGKVGGAYRLTRANGAKSRVEVSSSQFNFGFGSFTIDAWIKPEPCSLLSNPSLCHPRIIVGAMQQDLNANGFEFLVDNGKLGLRMATQTNLSNVIVVDDQWQHVAVVVDRSGSNNLGTFFYNGMPLNSFVPPPSASVALNPFCPIYLGSGPMCIGGPCSVNCGLIHYFNGWLDEIEVFRRALLPSEIAALYGAGAHGKCKPDAMFDARPRDIGDINGEGVGDDCGGSPMVGECFPGTGGVINCPCGQPANPAGGCANFGAGSTSGAVLSASGVADVSSDTLLLTTSNHRSPAIGVLNVFFSYKPGGQTPTTGLWSGAGVRCIGTGGDLRRLYTMQVFGGTGSKPGLGDLSISAMSASFPANQHTISPPETRHYFNVYRDGQAAGPCGNTATSTNLTNMGAVTWVP